jgi:sugar lactone lactonase YvrE
MKCDELGNVYVTGPGGIWVISPAAELLGRIEVPEVVGNINWGDADWKTLFSSAPRPRCTAFGWKFPLCQAVVRHPSPENY